MKKVEVKEVVNYRGHSIRANGSVDVSFSAMYDEIVNSIQLLQMLNNDVDIIAKLPGDKPIKLGVYRIKNVSFDDDGESKIKFNSIDTSVEFDNLSRIITSEKFQVKFSAVIEEEDDGEDNV